MQSRNWIFRLHDIIKSAEKILSHTNNLSFETFSEDEWTLDAVVRNFTIIGEAAKNIPEEVKLKYPVIPWLDISDMRNILVHQYFGIDVSIV
jgi:uncharacterized protein with HEPN domain